MADFCAQCSIENFNEDSGDLKNLGTRKLTPKELANGIGWSTICEGCGPSVVDDEGVCIAHLCLKSHGVSIA